MNKSEHINELAKALAEAQSELKGAVKDSSNPFFKSKYADLGSVWDACRIPLTKHGLSVSQITYTVHINDIKDTYLETILMHVSGQWISSAIILNPKDNTPQAFGSAITYYRRYALQAIVGVAAEDDDGESAMARAPLPQQQPRTPLPPRSGVNTKPLSQPKLPGYASPKDDDFPSDIPF